MMAHSHITDRVNVVEGIIEDISHGHVPNIPREMGLASEWRYNRGPSGNRHSRRIIAQRNLIRQHGKLSVT